MFTVSDGISIQATYPNVLDALDHMKSLGEPAYVDREDGARIASACPRPVYADLDDRHSGAPRTPYLNSDLG